MKTANQMQDRLLSTMRAMVDEWGLDWVEITEDPSRGTVRLQQPGRYRTLLKIEYEFEAQRCRLLVYREGKQICGRCSVDYDDGVAIEQFLAGFRCLFPYAHRGPTPAEPTVYSHSAASSRRAPNSLGMAFRTTFGELSLENADLAAAIPSRG